jgi:hypothetical protein
MRGTTMGEFTKLKQQPALISPRTQDIAQTNYRCFQGVFIPDKIERRFMVFE